jgi:hypothetical protein
MIEVLLSLGIFTLVATLVFDSLPSHPSASFALADRSNDETSQRFGEALFRGVARSATAISGTSRRMELAGSNLAEFGCGAVGDVVVLSTVTDGIECGGGGDTDSSVRFSYSLDGMTWFDRWPVPHGMVEHSRGAPLIRVRRNTGVDWIERAGLVE